MTFGQDLTKPVATRQFVDGIPLLLDLNEILNLDVINMAMKEQEALKVKRRSRKVLPETDEQSDPDCYVEERLSFISHMTKKDENIS